MHHVSQPRLRVVPDNQCLAAYNRPRMTRLRAPRREPRERRADAADQKTPSTGFTTSPHPHPTLSASGRKVSESDARSVAADGKSSTTELERSSFQLSKRPRLQALVYDILPSIKARLLNTDGLCFNGKRCSECAEGPHSFILSGARTTRSGQHRKSPGPPAPTSEVSAVVFGATSAKVFGALPRKSSERTFGAPSPNTGSLRGLPCPNIEVSGGSAAPTAEVSESTRLNIGSLPRPPRPNIGNLRGAPRPNIGCLRGIPPQHRKSTEVPPAPTSEVSGGAPPQHRKSPRGCTRRGNAIVEPDQG